MTQYNATATSERVDDLIRAGMLWQAMVEHMAEHDLLTSEAKRQVDERAMELLPYHKPHTVDRG